mgnify:CR=1 FL=1
MINKNKDLQLAIIGLGYVGLPLALEFAKTMSVIGFDINEKRVDMMKNNIDPSEELNAAAFETNCSSFVLYGSNVSESKCLSTFSVTRLTPC